MGGQSVVVAELREGDLPFLLALWHTPEVMRYADELPTLRGWSRSDDLPVAWARYQERRATLGTGYTQLILRLADGERLGESFFAPLPEGYTFGRWQKPGEVLCLYGMLYAVVRSLLETLRADDRGPDILGLFSVSQFFSLFLFITSLAAYVRLWDRYRRERERHGNGV